MTLIQRFLVNKFLVVPRLLHDQQVLIQAQNDMIRNLNGQLQRCHLQSLRGMRGLVGAWILHLEQPELDLRDDLHELDAQLGYQEAALEEHVV